MPPQAWLWVCLPFSSVVSGMLAFLKRSSGYACPHQARSMGLLTLFSGSLRVCLPPQAVFWVMVCPGMLALLKRSPWVCLPVASVVRGRSCLLLALFGLCSTRIRRGSLGWACPLGRCGGFALPLQGMSTGSLPSSGSRSAGLSLSGAVSCVPAFLLWNPRVGCFFPYLFPPPV